MTNALWSLSGAKDDWRLISSYGKYLDTRIQNLCTYQTSLMKDLDIIQTILGRPGVYGSKLFRSCERSKLNLS
jgi:hypothetical protein